MFTGQLDILSNPGLFWLFNIPALFGAFIFKKNRLNSIISHVDLHTRIRFEILAWNLFLRFIWNLRNWNRRSSTISTKKHFDRLKTLFDYSWIGWMVKSDFGLMMRFWIKPEWRAYITFFEKERPSALVSRTWLNFNTMLQQKHITFHKAHTRTTHQTDRTNERKRKGDRVGESQSGKERERQQHS